MFLPYEKSISEKIKRLSSKFNVSARHTKNASLKSKLNMRKRNEKQQGVVYEVSCNDCTKKYIGETGRYLEVRLKEHKNGGVAKDQNKQTIWSIPAHK